MQKQIIVIGAVSGGGKTSITKELNNRLQYSKALYFDDYDFSGPDDILDWIERGANCNEYDLSPLLSDMSQLLKDEEIKYILVDYPFARLHNQFTDIDLAVFIDTPLDIALARRLNRDYRNKSVEEILQDTKLYAERGRLGYESMLRTTKPNSDLIVDGRKSVLLIVEEIIGEINRLVD